MRVPGFSSAIRRGRIINNAIEGTLRPAGSSTQQTAWSATRTEVWEPKHLLLPPPTLIPPSPQ